VLIRNSWKIFINISSPQGERIQSRAALHKSGNTGCRKAAVRGKIMIISTLTPALSRWRERGHMIFFPPLAGFPKVALTKGTPSV
jgi:hypothetical protein